MSRYFRALAPLAALAAATALLSAPAGPGAAARAADSAPDATAIIASASSTAVGRDLAALTDAPTGGSGGLGAEWLSAGESIGATATLRFGGRTSVSSAQLWGATGVAGSTIAAGRLDFSDGTAVPVGALLRDGVHPTTVAFAPRVVDWIRFTVTRVTGSGAVGLAEFRALAAGRTPMRSAAAAPAPGGIGYAVASAASCDAGRAAAAAVLTVLCPASGAVVQSVTMLTVAAPGASRVDARVVSAEPGTAVTTVRAALQGAVATIPIDAGALPHGPFTVRIEAARPGGTEVRHLQLVNGGGFAAALSRPATGPAASGMILAFAEEFTDPLSVSRLGTGAAYASAKPEWYGAQEFGEAVFADPSAGLDNMAVVGDDALRISLAPRPASFTDPMGWSRPYVGGMLSSMRVGGSGFSAQYGYFEARMLAPAASGAWPAFWLLPADAGVSKQDTGAEIDIVELYGHDPENACHATHRYDRGTDTPRVRCVRPYGSADAALRWHTYGARVTPTEIVYYVDGVVTARMPQIAGGDEPMYFMVNLAAGGGWPIDLATSSGAASLFVDYIRVYT